MERPSVRDGARRASMLLSAVLLLSTGACPLEPNTKVQGAYVGRDQPATAPRPSGIYDADVWTKGWPPAAENAAECPNERAEFEKATGLHDAPSCGAIRARKAAAIGNGDDPVATPVAPHCYSLGKVILVVEYEEAKTSGCTRIVGIGVVPAK